MEETNINTGWQKRLKGVSDITEEQIGGISNTLIATEWGDEQFAKHYEKAQNFLHKKEALTTVVPIAQTYLTFYLGLEIPTATDLINMYKSVLPLITVGEITLFTEGTDPSVAMSPNPELKVEDYIFPMANEYRQSKYQHYEDTEVTVFWTYMEEVSKKDPQLYINLIGFIMINSLRLPKKEALGFCDHMPESGTKSFNSIYKGLFLGRFPPPGNTYIEYFRSYFPESASHTRHLYAHLVECWRRNTQNSDVRGYTKAAGLLALGDSGLGAIAWPNKAATVLGIKIGTFIASCAFTESLVSQIERVSAFAKNLDKGVTWPWCRLFEETALYQLSVRKNRDLCSIAAIVAMGDLQSAKNLIQFREFQNHLEQNAPIAEAIMKRYLIRSYTQYGTNEAGEIMQFISTEPVIRLTKDTEVPRTPDSSSDVMSE